MISLIAAHDINRGIGKNNTIPWHIPEDFKHFKETTMGHPVIMGRKTFESIGRPLPGRENIVVTRDTTYNAEGVTVTHSLEKAIEYAESLGNDEIFIIGGSELYKQALPLSDTLYITRIDHAFDVDSYFPEYADQFALQSENPKDNGTYHYSFQVWKRRTQA